MRKQQKRDNENKQLIKKALNEADFGITKWELFKKTGIRRALTNDYLYGFDLVIAAHKNLERLKNYKKGALLFTQENYKKEKQRRETKRKALNIIDSNPQFWWQWVNTVFTKLRDLKNPKIILKKAELKNVFEYSRRMRAHDYMSKEFGPITGKDAYDYPFSDNSWVCITVFYDKTEK